MQNRSAISDMLIKLFDAMSEPGYMSLLSSGASSGDFRRQALRPSKWREYREREREKNRASLNAMGLSGNIFEWPGRHMPKCMIARLYRTGAPGSKNYNPDPEDHYRDY